MGSQPLRAPFKSEESPVEKSFAFFFLLPLKKNVAKKKMMQSLMLVLLAVAGSQAAKLTATGVDLEPIFLFLDDDGENGVDATELKALTTTGDSDGDGLVTAAEFESAWSEIAVGFGVPASKHSKYFRLVDANADGRGKHDALRQDRRRQQRRHQPTRILRRNLFGAVGALFAKKSLRRTDA